MRVECRQAVRGLRPTRSRSQYAAFLRPRRAKESTRSDQTPCEGGHHLTERSELPHELDDEIRTSASVEPSAMPLSDAVPKGDLRRRDLAEPYRVGQRRPRPRAAIVTARHPNLREPSWIYDADFYQYIRCLWYYRKRHVTTATPFPALPLRLRKI